jgi:hypothetical protein
LAAEARRFSPSLIHRRMAKDSKTQRLVIGSVVLSVLFAIAIVMF